MKQQTHWFKAALALAGGVALIGAAQAQYTTNVLTDFHNFNLGVTYANWNVDGSDPLNGGSGFTPVITSGATSYTVKAQAYGSGAYDFTAPINLPGATMFLFTFTIDSPAGPFWMNPGLDIADGNHLVHLTASNTEGAYLNYSHYSGGNTYTLIGPLADQFGGAALDTANIAAFNLEFDPAEFGAGAPYQITYRNLALLTPVPEPSTLAMLCIGALGLGAARRRRG